MPAVRTASWDGDWSVAEPLLVGGLADCPTHGPTLDAGQIVVSDGQLIRAGQVLDSPEVGWVVSHPQAIDGLNIWLEIQGETRRIRVEETALLSREGSLLLGDAVVVAGEIWVPFQTDGAVVAAYSP